MTARFTPVGASGIVSYADDSSDIRVDAPGATALLVFNPDTANVVAVNAGYVEGDVDAVVPTSDFNGEGVIIGPGHQLIIALPQSRYATTQLYVNVAGVSDTGNVWITPGVAS